MIDSRTVARQKNCRLYPALPAHEIISRRNIDTLSKTRVLDDALKKNLKFSVKMSNGSEINGICQKRIYEFMLILRDDPDKWFTVKEIRHALDFKKTFAVTQPLDALLSRGLVIRRDIEFLDPKDKSHPYEYRVKS